MIMHVYAVYLSHFAGEFSVIKLIQHADLTSPSCLEHGSALRQANNVNLLSRAAMVISLEFASSATRVQPQRCRGNGLLWLGCELVQLVGLPRVL